jgi:hypothetical protein
MGVACEQHSAKELEEEHGTTHPTAGAVGETNPAHPEAPKSLSNTVTNTGGSGPAKEANDKGAPPAGRPAEAPSFFPPK